MAAPSQRESQVDAARRMYNARAPTYEDDRWHPAYSRHLMQNIAPARPGERILVLACGTGLESFIAAVQVGAGGDVVGIDVAEEMLAVANKRLRTDEESGKRKGAGRIRFLEGDVTNLEALEDELRDTRGAAGTAGSLEFDMIICSNAFVLFEDPAAVVRGWKRYLKGVSGRLVVDITHERNIVAGVVLDRAAKRMDLHFPLSRGWVESRDSFRRILEDEGYLVERLEVVEGITGHGTTRMALEQADEQFDWVVARRFTPRDAGDDFRKQILPVFREEWKKIADADGMVENVDSLYVYVARNS